MNKKYNGCDVYDEYVDPKLEWKYGAKERYQGFLDAYAAMQGVTDGETEPHWVENAFAEGSFCAKEYEKMRQAYERLCQRLGVEDQDGDLDCMVTAMEKIQKELCRRFYFLMDDVADCECYEDFE